VSRPGLPGQTAALLVGGAASFVAAVGLVRAIRPALLLDPDPSWALPRALLWILLASATACTGGLAAGAFLVGTRSRLAAAEPGPLFSSRSAPVFLAAAALCAGVFLRGIWISRLPIPFLGDDVNLIGPALALTGTWRDFADSIRPMPYGVSDPHEMIGVLYLRLFRGVLHLFGTTIAGVRVLSFAGGVLSLATGALLGRALLPRGGGALVALVLAGLRWHLIFSRWGWHSILLVPLVDVATILLLFSRRSGRALPAAAAGLLLGIGAHFYLAAWIPAAALLGFSVWPPPEGEESRARARRLVSCAAGLILAVAPLFLLREGRTHPYFGRTARHSVLAEIRYTRSLLPPFSAAADALVAPWLLPEPAGWLDLPGRSRLGWIVGVPVAVALSCSLRFPRRELSGLLLLHAAAAFAAAVAGGQAGHPNGFRFGYLTTVTAVAAAAGVLQLLQLPPGRFRRAAAIGAVGLLAASGAAGARDALLEWPERRSTFDSFHGEDTLIGRAAARWESYGTVGVEPRLGRSDATIDTVWRYRLIPGRGAAGSATLRPRASRTPHRAFRIAGARSLPAAGERLVERVADAWGRDWAVVLARASPAP